MPIKITDLELSQEITPLAVDGYNGVCALVRYHGRPIGWINSDSPLSSVLSIESVTRAVDDQVGWQCIQAVLGAVPGNAEPQSNGLPAVSVIVCIDDSISRISKVLHHLHHLEYPEYEVLLIDYGTAPRDRPNGKHIRPCDTSVASTRASPVRATVELSRHDTVWSPSSLPIATLTASGSLSSDPPWLCHTSRPLPDSSRRPSLRQTLKFSSSMAGTVWAGVSIVESLDGSSWETVISCGQTASAAAQTWPFTARR